MKMKTLALTAAIVATGLCATAANADQNTGPDGTITINGQVVAQTCQVDGKATGTADNKTVNLPNVLTTALASTGSTAGDTSFNIGVSGCDASLSTVQTYFSGGDINSAGRLSNSAASPAGNVDVELLNDSNNPMTLNAGTASNQGSQKVNLSSSGAATLTYTARYYATGVATAGAVKSTVDFTLIYQ